jgi:hypothetical protein
MQREVVAMGGAVDTDGFKVGGIVGLNEGHAEGALLGLDEGRLDGAALGTQVMSPVPAQAG